MNAMVWEIMLARRRRVKRKLRGQTYVDYVLDLSEDLCNGLSDDRNGGEKAGLANEDVQEGLMNADKL